jgi:DNA-binding HxlR family transcriptional regulator
VKSNKNIALAWEKRWSILKVLSDGKWHQTKDLKVETHVSSRTLYENLKRLTNYIERREERVAGKFPVSVYYRANPTLLSMFTQASLTEAAWKDIGKLFLEKKDLALALKQVNAMSNVNFMIAFSNFKARNIDITNPHDVGLFLEIFVWRPHIILTSKLTQTILESIDDLDLEKATKSLTRK